MDHIEQQIIKFISRNPGCNKEEVVEGVTDVASRVPLLKKLNGLIKLGIITSDAPRPKCRNRMYVKKDDLITSIPKQLDAFESKYFVILKKVLNLVKKPDPSIWNEYKSKYGKFPDSHVLQALLSNAIVVFHMMMNSYMLRSAFQWSQMISNKDYLINLNGTVFQRISELYTKLYENLKSGEFEGLDDMLNEVFKKIYSEDYINELHDLFEDFGLFEDLKKVGLTGAIEPNIDSCDEINTAFPPDWELNKSAHQKLRGN